MSSAKASLLIFITIFVVGCHHTREEALIPFNEFLRIDTLLVPRSTEFHYAIMPRWQSRIIEDTSYLIISSEGQTDLQLLVLNSEIMRYDHIISLPKNGPNGFRTNSPSFHFHNFDSIFVFPTTLNKILLYNSQSALINVHQFSDDHTLSFDANEQQQGGVLYENTLYISSIPFANPNDANFTQKTHVAHKLNLSTNNISVFANYPERFFNKVIPTSFLGGQIIQAFDNVIVVNNFHSDSIEFHNPTNKTSGLISTGMSGFDHLVGQIHTLNNQGQESFGLHLMYPNYYKILYNPYDQQIYRFSRHLNPLYKNYNLNEVMNEFKNNNIKLLQNTLVVTSSRLEKKYYKLPFEVEFAIPIKNGLIVSSSTFEQEDYDVFFKLYLDNK